MAKLRRRGEAYKGKGYGTLRYRLYSEAKKHVEKCLELGFYGEAVIIIESVITDRLESRISFLKKENVGFRNLGPLINEARIVETDVTILALLSEVDKWRESRNIVVHELVKIEEEKEFLDWEDRLSSIADIARDGYRLLKLLYNRVADLNPKHTDRVF